MSFNALLLFSYGLLWICIILIMIINSSCFFYNFVFAMFFSLIFVALVSFFFGFVCFHYNNKLKVAYGLVTYFFVMFSFLLFSLIRTIFFSFKECFLEVSLSFHFIEQFFFYYFLFNVFYLYI